MRDCKRQMSVRRKLIGARRSHSMKVILFGLKVNMKALPVMFICINIAGIFPRRFPWLCNIHDPRVL